VRRRPVGIAAAYIELSFAFRPTYGSGYNAIIGCYLDTYSPVDGSGYRYYVRIDASETDLDYESSSGVWTKIDDIRPPANEVWNKFKMVIDQVNHKLVSFETGNKVYALNVSGYALAAATEYSFDLMIVLTTKAANRSAMYVDNIVLRGVEK
jgi:hypothetical protein